MKHVFPVLFSVLILATRSFAQVPDYFPDGAEWRVRITNSGNYPYMLFQDDFVYYISGDTTIGAHTYRKIHAKGIYKEEYLFPPEPTVYTPYNLLQGLIRQDGRQVYIGVQSQGQFTDTLLYDFDLSLGDTLPQSWILSYDDVEVTAVDSIWIDGVYRKKFRVAMEGFENAHDSVLIEGVGHTCGFLQHFYAPWSHTNQLMCFAIDGVSWYQYLYDEWEEVCTFNLAVPEYHSVEVELFPNPCTDVLNVRLPPSERIVALTAYDLTGRASPIPFTQTILSDAAADVSAVHPGIYLMRFQTESGAIGTFRFIKN